MAEQPIKGSEIVVPGALDDLIKGADLLIDRLHKMEDGFKANLTATKNLLNVGKFNNSKDLLDNSNATKAATENLIKLEKVQTEITKTEKIRLQVLQEKEKVEQQRIKTSVAATKQEQEYNKQLEKTAKSLKDSNSEYAKASAELNKLKRQLQDLSVAGKTNTKEYENLNKQFQVLDKRVRDADASVGNFQRNVGNYRGQLKELQNQLSKLEPGTQQFKELAQQAGVLKDKIGDAKDAIKAYSAESKSGQAKTLFSQTLDSLKNLDFKDASDKAKQFAAVISSISFAETIAGVKDFGKAIIDVGKAILSTPLGIFLASITAVIAGIKIYRDTVNFAYEAQSDLNSELRKSNVELEKNRAAYQKSINQGLALNDQITEKEKKLRDFVIDANLKKSESAVKYQDEIKAILADEETSAFQKGKKILQISKDYSNASIIESRKNRQDILNIRDEFDKKEDDSAKKKAEEDKKKRDAELKERLKQIKDNNKSLNQELDKIRVENTLLTEQREIDNLKLENQQAADRIKATVGDEKTKARILVELEISLQQGLTAIRNKYADERKEAQKKENEEKLAKEKKLDDQILKSGQNNIDVAQQNFDDAKAKQKKKDDARKKQRKEDFEEAMQFEQELLDAIAKAEAEKSKLRQDGFNKQISDQEKNIDTQRKLAEKGLNNTLAEEEARKAQLERQKEEEKEKELKRQKAIAFFKAFSGYLEKGDEAIVALGKAATATVLADAVAGAFFTGTEKVEDDLKGNKVHNGKDGYRIAVDGSERILTGNQNKMVGDISNEALAKLAYDYNNGFLDTVKYTAIPSSDFAKNVYESAQLNEIIALRKEVQGVKEAIDNKPVSNYTFTGYEFIKETLENNHKTIVRQQLKRPRI